MFRAQFFFQFPQDPNEPEVIIDKAELGEFISDQDNIWRALDEARSKRHPIAQALLCAYPGLHYVRHSEVEIQLRPWDPQIPLFDQVLIDGGPQPA